MGGSYVATAADHQMVQINKGHLQWLQDHEPILKLDSIWVFDTR